MSTEIGVVLNNFVPSWRTNSTQAIPEIASCLQEDQRKVDDYCFDEDENGDLISPTARCKIVKVVNRDTEVGQLEGQAVDFINEWFKGNSEGAVAWVSAPDKVYPVAKVIVSEIINQQGRKRLLNRAILFDSDEGQCLEIAKILSEHSLNRPLLTKISEVRATPLTLDKDRWLNIIEEAIVLPDIWEKVRSGKDLIEQVDALKTAGYVYNLLMSGKEGDQQKAAQYFIGGDLSCPEKVGGLSPLELFLAHSVVLESCKKIKCGKPGCGWEAKEEDFKKIQRGEMTCCPDCGWKPGE